MPMPTLKDTYPLYLNNKAAQPNTDLAVTDKFTGEVAFRTALASPEIIDEAIAGAVRAAEPMARLASYERQAVLQQEVEFSVVYSDDPRWSDLFVEGMSTRTMWSDSSACRCPLSCGNV